jgi:parallel beta-helix repeat protein
MQISEGLEFEAGWTPQRTASQQSSAHGTTTVLVPRPAGVSLTDTANVIASLSALTSILASGPASLVFEDGIYQVDSNQLVIRNVSNFAIKGSGATVIQQAPNTSAKPNNTSGDIFIIADCTDFTVSGITFDGNRDSVAPLTPLSASASSGQPSVTVAAGNGSRYQIGQVLGLFGGLGASDQNQSENFAVGLGGGRTIQSITPGGGSGGGDLITFTTNLASSYSQISSTVVQDDFGPYAYAGDYLTCYAPGVMNTVAGRTLQGEDQQCGLHLINCQRFDIDGVTARNTWQSPVKLGTGFNSSFLTDGCSYGRVVNCNVYHGYDQGISVWNSKHVTVQSNVCDAAGWAGIAMSARSDNCSVTGNQVLNSVYRVPGNTAGGHGIAIEAGTKNLVSGNKIVGPYGNGVFVRLCPPVFTITSSNAPTISTFLEGGTAAGTSIQVSSSAQLQLNGFYSILDGARSEIVTIASVVDSTHVTFSEQLRFSHASGTYISARVSQENIISDNNIYGAGLDGINILASARNLVKGNTVANWGSGNHAVNCNTTSSLLPATLGGDGSSVESNILGGGPGIPVYLNGVSQMLLRDNRIFAPAPGSSYQGMIVYNVSDSKIEGNHFSEILDSQALFIAVGSSRITVANNVFTRIFNQAILVQNSDSVNVSGCIVHSSGGIDFQGVTNSSVTCCKVNSNKSYGIQLENYSVGNVGCSGNLISGNTVRDDGSGYNVTTGGTWTQQNGIVETGNSNNNIFTNNEIDSNAVAQLTVTGTGSSSYANIISGALQAGSSTMASNAWQPSDSSYLAVTYDPATGGSGRAPSNGVINLCAFYVRATTTITKIRMVTEGVTSASLTSNENFAGLYNSSGNLVAITADQSGSGNWGYTSNGSIRIDDMTLTVQSSFSLTLSPGIYYGAFVMNGTTLSQFISNANTNASWLTGFSSASSLRYATNGSNTTLPGTLTLSSNVAAQVAWWMALA